MQGKKDAVVAQSKPTTKWGQTGTKNILLPAALKRKRPATDLAARNAALKARLFAQRANKGKGKGKAADALASAPSKPATGPAPNSIAAIAAGVTTAAAATAASSAVEFKDKYDPLRPNDFEEWELIFSRDERARKERERKSLFKSAEKLQIKSRNTAAFAPPPSMIDGNVVVKSGGGGGSAGSAFAPPAEYNDAGSEKGADNDSDDDPFANLPVSGYGGDADAAAAADPFDKLPVTGYGGSKQHQEHAESGDDAYAARVQLRGNAQSSLGQHPARAALVRNDIDAKGEQSVGSKMLYGTSSAAAVVTPAAPAASDYGPAVGTSTAAASPAAAAAAEAATTSTPSRVLLLTNMVGPNDDLTDLDNETSTECSNLIYLATCMFSVPCS